MNKVLIIKSIDKVYELLLKEQRPPEGLIFDEAIMQLKKGKANAIRTIGSSYSYRLCPVDNRKGLVIIHRGEIIGRITVHQLAREAYRHHGVRNWEVVE